MCENMTEFISHAKDNEKTMKEILNEANKEINEFVTKEFDKKGFCYASELAEILEKTLGFNSFSARYKHDKFHGFKNLEG